MTQADFKLESISERSVEVTHIAEGHWYRFKINKDQHGIRQFTELTHRQADTGKHSADCHRDAAAEFALLEARKAKLIDN